MKKILFLSALLGLIFISSQADANQMKFHEAIKTCETFEQLGAIPYKSQIFDIKVNIEKKRNKCVYTEKIFQGKDYHLLTCNFKMEDLDYISNSMKRFTESYPKQMEKNRIFEAKMTTNAEIYNNYVADPKYCTITNSLKKQQAF